MITDYDEAYRELEAAVRDTIADNPEVSEDDVWHDMVASIALMCDDATALELCRTQLGSVPFDLEARLGRGDWVQ